MSFESIMASFGTGVGNFVGPVTNSLGTDTTQSTTTTTKASSSTTLIVIAVIVVVVIVGYFLFKPKTKKAEAAATA